MDGKIASSADELRPWPTRLGRRLQRLPAPPRVLPLGDIRVRGVILRLILALGLATLLWIRVSEAEDPVRIARYPAVTIVPRLAPAYSLRTSLPKARIELEGLSSAMQDASPPTASIDLTHPPAAMFAHPVPVPVEVAHAPDLQVAVVNPRTVSVWLERSKSKMIPVQVQLSGGVPPGYQISAPVVTPPDVEISGPEHIINSVKVARITLDASKIKTSETLYIVPVLYDTAGQAVTHTIVKITPSPVRVSVQVRPRPYAQLVPVVPDIRGHVARGYRISSVTVNPQLVTVLSDISVGTTVLKTEPIDISGATHSLVVVKPLLVPATITLNPPTQIAVQVGIVPALGSAVTTVQIAVTGQRPGTTVTVSPSTLTVTYQGPLPQLDHAVAPQATLDLRQRGPGSYDLTPRINAPAGLSVVSITPAHVHVHITGRTK